MGILGGGGAVRGRGKGGGERLRVALVWTSFRLQGLVKAVG